MKIMYLTKELSIGGVTKCIYNLCQNITPDAAIICSNEGELKEDFTRLGMPYYAIPNVEKKNPFLWIYTLFKIRQLVKREKVTLIHSHHRMTTFLGRLSILGMSTKIIHTQHLNIQNKFLFTGITLRKMPVICVSNAAKKILESKSNLNENNVQTIYNTIDDQTTFGSIDMQIEKMKENGNFIVTQVSRLVDYKGVYEFLEIANKVSEKNSMIKFFLIGNGPEHQNIIDKISELQLEETVFLLGAKKNVLKQLESIDLMLLCSKKEGLPLAPIEAFYKGIPVIGSDIDGTKEEIEHEKNGFLISQKDISEFAKKIIFLAQNPEVCKQMKKAALKTFESKFTKEKYLQDHFSFYEKVLERSQEAHDS